MDDYIKRKDAEMSHCSECSWNGCCLCPCEDVKAILAIPAADVVKVVYCRDCVYRPEAAPGIMSGVGVEAPRDEEGWSDDTCPYLCGDPWYNVMPHDDWFCHHGERKKDDDAQGSL